MLCFLRAGLSFPLFLDGRSGPPDRRRAVGVGTGGAVLLLVSLQPQLVFTRCWLTRQPPNFRQGSSSSLGFCLPAGISLACPAATSSPVASSQLAFRCCLSSLGIPSGSFPAGEWDRMMPVWGLCRGGSLGSAPIKSHSLCLSEPSCSLVPGKASPKVSGQAFPAFAEQFPASVRALSPWLSGSAPSFPC